MLKSKVLCHHLWFYQFSRFNSQEWSMAIFWLPNKEITCSNYKCSIQINTNTVRYSNRLTWWWKKWFVMYIIVIESYFPPDKRPSDLKDKDFTKPENDFAGSVCPIFPRLPICPFTNHNHNNCTLLLQLPKIFSPLARSLSPSLFLFHSPISIWFETKSLF